MLLQHLKQTPDKGTAALKSALRVTAAAAWIAIASASAASAGTVVEEWSFTLDNAFIEWTQVGNVGDPNTTDFGDVEGDNPNTLLGGPSLLRWGIPEGGGTDPNDQSSIEVGEVNGHFDSTTNIKTHIDGTQVPPAGMAQPGNLVPTVTLTHRNNPLAPSANMDTATLLDVLTLTAVGPTGVDTTPQPIPPLAFMIRFAETSNPVNEGDSGDPMKCADEDSEQGKGCNDIFVLDVPLAAFNPLDESLNQLFVFDDYLYNAKIQLEGLGPLAGSGLAMLTEKECKAVLGSDFTVDDDPSNNCIGLTTQENMDNSFQAFLSIQFIGAAVPEPGALAIFGLGLAGLGFMRRRRKV